ncbi:MAG: NAD(P)-dependent oxidoreductase, partial [Rhodospirillales bacterium]|nr:NAD(P)-dependent oxidoreductase [Rhodospirillales bacterium]
GVYGRSKEEGEQAIRARLLRHVIIRTAWVFAAHGHNFVKTMLRLAAERDELRVVADQRGCPTAAADLAQALIEMARQMVAEGRTDAFGTYHFAGDGPTTWHGFAEAIITAQAARSGRHPNVIPIATADYPTPARRPANSVLDCGKIGRVFGIRPRPWRETLGEVLEELRATV